LRRNCFLKKQKKEKKEKREVTVRQGRIRKQQLDDLKEKRRHWNTNLHCVENRFDRGYGSVIRDNIR
jgi:hypothetical protein